MKALVLKSAAVIALAIGSVGAVQAQGNGYGQGNGYFNGGNGNPGYGNPGYGYQGNAGNGSYYGGNAFAFVLPYQVAHAERELANAGYYNGPIDGNMGPEFSHALMAYQNSHGLPSTGGLNPPTMRSLDLSMHPYNYQPNGMAPGYGYNGMYGGGYGLNRGAY